MASVRGRCRRSACGQSGRFPTAAATALSSAGGDLTLVLVSDVPCNKGMASSAAVEMAVAGAVAALWDAVGRTELALLCQRVENAVAGAACGFMDQMTAAHGRPGALLSLLCPIDSLSRLMSRAAAAGLALGRARLRREALHCGSAYRRVRTAAFMGRRILADSPAARRCSTRP